MNLKKLTRNIERWFISRLSVLQFYMYWLIIVVVVFGAFGIVPRTADLIHKFEMLSKFKESARLLSTKTTQLQVYKTYLEDNHAGIEQLVAITSLSRGVQGFLVDVAYICNDSGYLVTKFIPTNDKTNGNISIQLDAEGKGDPAILLKNIENMKNPLYVESMKVSNAHGKKQVSIKLVLPLYK